MRNANPSHRIASLAALIIWSAWPGILPADPVYKEAITSGETVPQLLQRAIDLRNSGSYAEGLDVAHAALQKAEEEEDVVLGTEAHYEIAILHYYLEEYSEARAHLEIGLTLARQNSLLKQEGDLLSAQGVFEWKVGNLTLASRLLQEALAIQTRENDRISMASTSNNLGLIAYSLKNFEEAANHYRQALEWLGELDNARMRASLYSNLGEALIHLDRLGEAEKYLYLSLAIEESLNDPYSIAYTHFNLGELRAREGQADKAISRYEKALELQISIGNRWAASLTRLRMGEEFLRQSDTEAALGVLLPGYEAIKALNALSMLRDYTEVLSRTYAIRMEKGRSRYYEDLHAWFSRRLNESGTAEDGLTEPSRAQHSREARGEDASFAGTRLAIITILGVLIILLMVENMRLRKRMKAF